MFESLVSNIKNIKLIKEALKAEPSIVSKTDLKTGRTLLHFASGHGIDEVLLILISS
jgi:hypothetical protein